jgi:hypothetical protein
MPECDLPRVTEANISDDLLDAAYTNLFMSKGVRAPAVSRRQPPPVPALWEEPCIRCRRGRAWPVLLAPGPGRHAADAMWARELTDPYSFCFGGSMCSTTAQNRKGNLRNSDTA